MRHAVWRSRVPEKAREEAIAAEATAREEADATLAAAEAATQAANAAKQASETAELKKGQAKLAFLLATHVKGINGKIEGLKHEANKRLAGVSLQRLAEARR
mmetsp:Transcript_28969/g.95175  ORF Transcript_28969/g.95175 Transcript_28969/m.95175 type:complete len:102 (-) Transcript_28969:395-700(-)